jgi:hypothetical protein
MPSPSPRPGPMASPVPNPRQSAGLIQAQDQTQTQCKTQAQTQAIESQSRKVQHGASEQQLISTSAVQCACRPSEACEFVAKQSQESQVKASKPNLAELGQARPSQEAKEFYPKPFSTCGCHGRARRMSDYIWCSEGGGQVKLHKEAGVQYWWEGPREGPVFALPVMRLTANA